ncbi:hypothetical protein SAMN05421890_4934 [Ensifer adhaerens]|nr:hypothetical protein SAMN05421890_4934 [Ensifer adhaerens]
MRGRQVVFQEPLVLPLNEGFLAQPLLVHLPRRHQKMCVVVSNVARIMRPVDGEIHPRAVAVRQVLGELPRQLQALLGRQLMRQCDFKFTGDTRVFPAFGEFRRIPKLLAALRPFRANAIRKHDFRMLHTLLAGEVMRDAIAFVRQALAGTIGRRGNGASAAGPRYRLHACVIDRQTPSVLSRSTIGASELRSNSKVRPSQFARYALECLGVALAEPSRLNLIVHLQHTSGKNSIRRT